MKKSKLVPKSDRIIVQPADVEEKTKGGLTIPKIAQERQNKGTVVAISKDIIDDIKAGDTILFSKTAGTPVDFEGQKLLVMRISDVLAVIQ